MSIESTLLWALIVGAGIVGGTYVVYGAWQAISEKDRNAILDSLEAIAQDTLKQAEKAEQDLVAELTKKGMTFITEKDGLKVAEFREKVSAEINKDFPSWKPYMDRIAAIK